MKIYREIKRIIKQIFKLPANIIGFFFSTYYYDFFLSKRKKIISGNIPLGKKIIIYVIFPINGLSKFHIRTLNYFLKMEYSILVVSNTKLEKKDEDQLIEKSSYFIERENYGHDFGGWRDGIIFLKEKLTTIENLILINDSTWFPVTRGNDFIDFIQKSKLDFVGATSHYGLERPVLSNEREKLKKRLKFDYKNKNFHYASYVLSFSNKILKDKNFLNFWLKLRLSNTYNVIVRNCEIAISQWVINNSEYTHGSLIDSSQISKVLNNYSRKRLYEITQYLVVNSDSLKKFVDTFSNSLESFSKDELISFIMTVVSRQIIVFSLINFLVKELNFPFLKKRLFNLDQDCAEKTKKIVMGFDKEIRDEILLEIYESPNLSKFMN